MKLWHFIFLLLFVISCSQDKQINNEKKTALKPISLGRSDELVVVVDDLLWNSEVGDSLRDALNVDFPVTARSEKAFKTIKQVSISEFDNKLKRHSNIVIPIIDSDRSLTGEHFNQMLSNADTSKFQFFIKHNLYARNQQVMFLYTASTSDFVNYLDKETLLGHLLNQAANKKGSDKLKTRNKKLEYELYDELGLFLKVPKKFKKADLTQDFFWFRKADNYEDMNLWGIRVPYTETVSDSLVHALRDSVGSMYIFGSDSSSFMKTSRAQNLYSIDRSVNGKYLKETRGLWEMSAQGMGGSFISYTFLDREENNMYYIEGFVYAPNKPKAKYIKELQAVLNSFSIDKK